MRLTSRRPFRRPIALALLPLCLGACAHQAIQTAETAKSDCTAFGLISYSKADTDETIRQIKAHDAAWRAMCSPAN